MKASDETANGSGAERTAQAGGSRQPDSGLGQRSGTRRADITVGRAGQPGEWRKKKYAGSVAEDLWRRLDAMEVINQGMLFAATLLLCLFPFLIVASALAGRPWSTHWPGTPA